MKNLFCSNSQLVKLLWLILLVAGFGGTAFGATFTVTKIADTNDNVCDADCSLREAIAAANAATSDDIINFNETVFATAQTILLGGGRLEVGNNGSLVINGTGANLLTISGGNLDRVFVFQGVTATLNGIRIINGKILGNGDGGGIFNNFGTITINDSIISNNSGASGDFFGGGGGIYNRGAMFINGTTISNNSAVSQGGGVYSEAGSSGMSFFVNINNSVIRDNTTNGIGGGVDNGFQSTLNVTNTVVNNNSARSCGGLVTGPTAELINLTVTNNQAIQGGGGGICVSRTVTLTNSIISQNTSGVLGGGLSGGDDARITISNSTISGNSSASGGGIFNSRGLWNINGTTLSGNSAVNGGAIYNDSLSNTLTLNNSMISGNTASGDGGGINNAGGTVTVTNSTVNANNAVATTTEGGGGIYNSVATTNVINSTIIGNTTAKQGGGVFNRGTVNLNGSTINNNGAVSGGGVFNFDFRTVNARNTIIADNTISGDTAPDFRGAFTSQGYNLIENTAGTTITGTTTSNILGRDPQLAPLRNNGGATQTVALQAGSPAIDAADPANFPATDQRGIVRPQDGDLNGSALPDIGSYERQPTAFAVTKTADSNDGVCNTDCSLREAIAAANAATTLDNAVVFNAGIFGAAQTLTLTNGELQINNTGGTFAVIGTGANLLTISANNQSRVFFVNSGANVALSGLRIIGGSTPTNGGSIYNAGRLTVSNSTVAGNTAANFGGGIFNNDGAMLNIINSMIGNNSASVGGGIFSFTNSNLTITGSTVGGNNASSGYGGGISNNAGTLALNNSTISGNGGGGIYNGGVATVHNSTISGNSAPNGGGIFNDVLLNITNSTVARNTAANQGGGIFRNDGTVTSRNSMIADNAAANSAPDYFGALTSQGYNLIENISGTIISGTTVGNVSGQDPLLLPLADNGGATQTHALRLNSPAIDKGNSFGANTDQRGQLRPFDFPNVSNSTGGNGADIGAFERQPTDRSGSTLFDFDGDGKADVSVFRPANGTWYLQQSAAGFAGVSFGQAEDKIVPGDYDGDGKTDVAVFRAGVWYLQRSSLGFTGVTFGEASDIPVPADYDGDGKTDVAVFRPANGTWYLLRSSAGFVGVAFGQSGDRPAAADYDGDGRADVAVFRAGTWYILRSQLGFIGIVFGETTDKPVPADYDGDGKTDVAVFRPSNGTWYLQRSQLGFAGIAFGLGTDLPTPADFDGDGKADVAVFRDGTWYLQRSTQGFTGVSFGAAADRPVPNAFIP